MTNGQKFGLLAAMERLNARDAMANAMTNGDWPELAKCAREYTQDEHEAGRIVRDAYEKMVIDRIVSGFGTEQRNGMMGGSVGA